MYDTPGDGIQEIRYNELRQKSLEELESMARQNLEDSLVRQVIADSLSKVDLARKELESKDIADLLWLGF